LPVLFNIIPVMPGFAFVYSGNLGFVKPKSRSNPAVYLQFEMMRRLLLAAMSREPVLVYKGCS